MNGIKLVVFDMAGTTVRDQREVESCFYQAAVDTGLRPDRKRIQQMQGLPKLEVVQTLWNEALGADHPDFEQVVGQTFDHFRDILENHYRTHEVAPTEGTLELFQQLRAQGIKIALTTGFYRKVTDIILHRLGWDAGLDEHYRGSGGAIIDLSLTPDETGGRGRPHPDMILRAMQVLGVSNPAEVINIGDTPVDLQSGRAAGVRLSLAVTNGTHSRAELLEYDNDGLLDHIGLLPAYVSNQLAKEEIKN